MSALGWAAREGGRVLVDTVSISRRAAMVNWLWAHADRIIGCSDTDHQIETWWHAHRAGRDVELVRVKIVEVADA